MFRRPFSTTILAGIEAFLLLMGTRSATPFPQLGPSSPAETDDSQAVEERVTRAYLDAINEFRLAEPSPPLQLSGPLSEAARKLLERTVIEPNLAGFDAAADLTREDLQDSGYDPQQWAVGLASSMGEPDQIVALWRQSDPQSFESFLEPGLRDFGLATEIRAIQPVYVLVAATSRAHINQPILESLSDLDTVRRTLLSRVNQERRDRGLGPLHSSSDLSSAAQDYADRMLREEFYGHVSPQGETVLDRIEDSGYRPELTGENLASGPQSAEQAMDSWMASEGHRKNILDHRFRDIGFGVSVLESEGELKVLWVQCFGRRRP